MIIEINIPDISFNFREMCLAQALAIHAVMKQEKCPDNLLNVDTGMIVFFKNDKYCIS